MGMLTALTSFLLFTVLSLTLTTNFLEFYEPVGAASHNLPRNRETIEIIIGGGGGQVSAPAPFPPDYCPPPPPPAPEPLSPPPPSGFESELIARVYPVIQALGAKITDDPQGYKKTWKGNNVCAYKGFVCSIRPDKKMKAVAGVDFNGAGFYGKYLTLEGFLDKLPDLAFFHVNSNNFTGSVPRGVSEIKYLYELDFSNNKLTGAFPSHVLNVKSLFFLDLRYNQLSGSVPAQAFSAQNSIHLDALFINNNQFSQTLPDNLGDTTAVCLTLANNRFTGPIPRSIGCAKQLEEVLFLNNQLSGCLPYEIGFLWNVTVFDVGGNQLTGPIPHSFGCLTNIQELNLAQNRLYGAVPEMVCELPNVVNLSLSNNYLTEVGPECRKLIKMKRVDVRMNCILGLPNQRPNSECAAFFSNPFHCTDHNSFTLVPCKTDTYSKELTTQPTAYHSLLPHRA